MTNVGRVAKGYRDKFPVPGSRPRSKAVQYSLGCDLSRDDHKQYDAALQRLRAEAEAIRRKEPKFKWQDALAVVSAFLALVSLFGDDVRPQIGCFVLSALLLCVSFFSHKNWGQGRYIASLLVLITFGGFSYHTYVKSLQKNGVVSLKKRTLQMSNDILKFIEDKRKNEPMLPASTRPQDLPGPVYMKWAHDAAVDYSARFTVPMTQLLTELEALPIATPVIVGTHKSSLDFCRTFGWNPALESTLAKVCGNKAL